MGKTKPKTRPNPRVEFCPHTDRHMPWVDEVVAHDVEMIHIEQMSVDSFWMGIYFNNNPEVRVSCYFEVGGVVKDDEGNETRELRLQAVKERIRATR